MERILFIFSVYSLDDVLVLLVYIYSVAGPAILEQEDEETQLQVQWTLFITAFVITAKFVIPSSWSAQKSADIYFFHWQSHVIL